MARPTNSLIDLLQKNLLFLVTQLGIFCCILSFLCPRIERVKTWITVRALTAWERKGELMQFSVKQGRKRVWEHQSCTWKTLLESLWHKKWWQVLAKYDRSNYKWFPKLEKHSLCTHSDPNIFKLQILYWHMRLLQAYQCISGPFWTRSQQTWGKWRAGPAPATGKASSCLEQQATRHGQMTTSSSASIYSLCQSSRKPGQKVRTLLWKKGRSFWLSYGHISTTTVGTPGQNFSPSNFLSYCRRHLANTPIYGIMCQILAPFPA